MAKPFKARPKRQRKADRLISGSHSAETIRCDYALGPFDAAVRAANKKWGVERLPDLVSTTTAEKFGSAMAKLNNAIDANDPDVVAGYAESCIRGLAVMDAEATAAGQPQADPKILEYEIDGFCFGIMPESAYWQVAQEQRPDLKLYSLQEIGALLAATAGNVPAIDEIKNEFPGAAIARAKLSNKFFNDGGDEIPF